ncbi:hypothetical protein MKW92_046512 [Papaver armeniacum]|nr:hypothetical protein MKW92_046512 [Papaver armeniacum]
MQEKDWISLVAVQVMHFLMLLSISGADLDLTKMRGILLKPVSGNFIVVDHDIFWSYYEFESTNLDSSQVTSSGGNVVNYLKGTSGDKFEFKAPRAGMYKLCFHNPYSTPETVSFYIHVGHIPNEHDLAKDEHLDPINVKIAELREALESVTAEQKYLKARGSRHRHISSDFVGYAHCLCVFSFSVQYQCSN